MKVILLGLLNGKRHSSTGVEPMKSKSAAKQRHKNHDDQMCQTDLILRSTITSCAELDRFFECTKKNTVAVLFQRLECVRLNNKFRSAILSIHAPSIGSDYVRFPNEIF